MNQNPVNPKQVILFDEYKRGFSAIEKLVSEFEGISNGSQIVFLTERERMLLEQHKNIKVLKETAIDEIRKLLVVANSKMLSLLDMEKYIENELEKCSEIRKQIESGTTE